MYYVSLLTLERANREINFRFPCLIFFYHITTGVLVAQDASGGATLVIEKCEMSDAGTFTAKGINEVGEAETSCTVTVSKPMEEPKFTSLLRYQYDTILNIVWKARYPIFLFISVLCFVFFERWLRVP